MKKLFTPITIIIAVICLSSCTKDYNCNCTFTYDGDTETYHFIIPETSKKTAKIICKGYEVHEEDDDGTSECELD